MPIITITPESIVPFAAVNSDGDSTGFSYTRGHYTRQNNGELVVPTLTQYRRSLHNILLRSGLSTQSVEITTDIPSITSTFQTLFSRVSHTNPNHFYITLILATNALCLMKRKNDSVHYCPHVDYICSASDDSSKIEKFSKKFNDKCMLTISNQYINRLKEHYENRSTNSFIEFLERIISYSVVRTNFNVFASLTNVQILRRELGDGNNPQLNSNSPNLSDPLPRVARRIQPQRTNYLREHYTQRENREEEHIYTTKQLGEMLQNLGDSVELSVKIRKKLTKIIFTTRFVNSDEE